jgi:hypothetical protein
VGFEFYVDGGLIRSSILPRNGNRGGTTFDSIYKKHPDGSTTKHKLSFARLVRNVGLLTKRRGRLKLGRGRDPVPNSWARGDGIRHHEIGRRARQGKADWLWAYSSKRGSSQRRDAQAVQVGLLRVLADHQAWERCGVGHSSFIGRVADTCRPAGAVTKVPKISLYDFDPDPGSKFEMVWKVRQEAERRSDVTVPKQDQVRSDVQAEDR